MVTKRYALPRPVSLRHLSLGEAVDKFRRWETKKNPLLKGSKWIWLKDQSNYTDKQQAMYDRLMTCNLKIAKVWAVKEQFRTLIQQEYAGDMEAYLYFSMWFDDAIALKSSAMEAVAFTFKRHLKGIVRGFFSQMLAEKIEEQIRLATTSHSGHYFYHPIVLAVNEFLQMNVSLNHHRCLLFLRKCAIFVCKCTTFNSYLQTIWRHFLRKYAFLGSKSEGILAKEDIT